MTQTDFAAGKNIVSLAKNIYAKESLVSNKEKKCPFFSPTWKMYWTATKDFIGKTPMPLVLLVTVPEEEISRWYYCFYWNENTALKNTVWCLQTQMDT